MIIFLVERMHFLRFIFEVKSMSKVDNQLKIVIILSIFD